MSPSRIRESASRSLTLMHTFLLASALILVVGGLLLASVLDRVLQRQAVEGRMSDATIFATDVLSPAFVHADRLAADPVTLARLRRTIRLPSSVRSVKVWTPDGRLLFTTLAPDRIGRRFPVDAEVRRVVSSGAPIGAIENIQRSRDVESSAERAAGIGRVLNVYAPVLGTSGRPIGVYELYLDTTSLDALVAGGTRDVWIAVVAVFGALYLALALLVRRGSRKLSLQTRALRERSTELVRSYRLLEESSLGAIETLNAAVEAKDPYTAGHSQRVRALALLVGRELGLPGDRLEVLAASALFHDVGKIGVPDGILTKPGRLRPEEFEVVKQHAAKGAEIVSKLPRLEACVPAIRHHHERWDGLGYPDALLGEEIPLEASIVGLADAWDAMTTLRPYAPAMTLDAATEQLRAGRGTQFRPEVVDAFLGVAERTRLEAVAEPSVRGVRTVAATG